MATQPERGLTVRANRTISDPRVERDMLKRLILKGGVPSEELMNLFIGICDRYDFDPMLKHVAIISNNIYVTRDGLLHKAHTSGQLDGIEVEMRLVEGEWAATCAVHRKDMSRPIRYTAFMSDHRPDNAKGDSAWGKYPRAMLQKCAEVMALRRAFDISLGAVEEQGFDSSAFDSEYRVNEAAPPRQPAPSQLAPPEPIEAAVVAPGPAAMTETRFGEFIRSIERMAHQGIASSEILASLNNHRDELSKGQMNLVGDLWKRIRDARKAGQPWPDPDEAPEGQVSTADAMLVENVAPGNRQAPPTAATLAASADPFGDKQPAGYAG